jgi:hypothetical protein
MQAMDLISQYIPQLPESSRKAVINAKIAAIAGQSGQETFGIPDEQKLDGSQLSIASLENNAFSSGGQVLLDPDQNHYVHMNVHLQFCGQVVQAVQNQQQDPRQASVIFQSAIPHMITHMQYLESDPTRKEQYDALAEQMGELLKLADQMNQFAAQISEQEAQQQAQQQGQGMQDPKMAVAENRIMLDRAKFENDAQIKQAKAQHQMELQDKRTSQRLAIDKIRAASKYSNPNTLNQTE